jgi:hypothetical protein
VNRSIAIAAVAVLCAAASYAGDSPRSVRAVRTTTPPRIDGTLDDAAWGTAEPTAGFIQRDPDEGKPGSEPTEVRVLYDAEALYVGFTMDDADPAGIVSRLSRRDDEIESDQGSVRIDAYHDQQTAYEFSFNAAGVKTDILQFDDGAKEDASWDPVWEIQTSRSARGWTAELKIPFRILRYRSGEPDSGGQTWGINFFRYISRKQEVQRWAFTPKNESGFISRFGHVTGLKDLPDPRQLEVMPFMVTKQLYEPERGPLGRRQEFLGNAGLDLRYGLSKSFTLDATVNPDFGQVEADPAVLNLSTFETFYPEKRPFFIGGTQIIRFSTFGGDFGPGMFYSRRIGRAISPRELSVPPGGRILEVPDQATILGAAKLTGRTDGGLSIGILQAVTQEERGTVADSLGRPSDQIVEPLAHYNIIRLKQEVLGNSYVGMIVTTTAKHSRNPAFTNGYDWNLNLGQNTYALTGFLALSHATNNAGERISGSAGKVSFSRVAADHWLWGVSGDYTTTKYNINDVGFFFSPDDIGHNFSLTYKEDVPAAVVRNYSLSASYHQRWTFAGANIARDARVSGGFTFANYWGFEFGAGASHGRYDHRETRGNGLYEKPSELSASIELSTDHRNDVIIGIGERFSHNARGSEQMSSGVSIDLRPLSWIQTALEYEYSRVRNDEAWMTNADTGSGRMSIFGDRSTDQHNVTLRTAFTFTRELTLQYYGQVFLAKGYYRNYRRLVGTSDFTPYPASADLSGEDFNSHALNSNLVLRWEYHPGSTLYLVWSQARDAEFSMPFTSFSDDVRETFRTAPANVLLLKVSYWLSI